MRVLTLTREMTNYAERLAVTLRVPITELWGIVLAATGRMTYVDSAGRTELAVRLGVPDTKLEHGSTRFAVWREALHTVVEILGDPEASYRTGDNSQELRAAVDAFFGESL